MGVLKYSSVRYGGSGVDIGNAVVFHRQSEEQPEPEKKDDADTEDAAVEQKPQPDEREVLEAEKEKLARREAEIVAKEREIERLRDELAALKEQYIEQGKEVILEAKRRADEVIANAEDKAQQIAEDAEKNRGGVFIKARAEGFEQGKKDGVAACLAQGEGVLNEARSFMESINARKAELFSKYEKEIFDTVMEIANKVTLDSMAVKDGTAAKKLIKKAAKDFRNSQLIRITLDENGATTKLAGDYEYLKELCGGVAHVEVELLADGEPGTVIVDNGEEITDAGIQTQLKMIKELGSGMFLEDAPKKRRRKKAAQDVPEEPEEEQEESDYIEE